jgi:hypothetical membrane protein
MVRAYVGTVAPLLLLGALLIFGATTPGYDPIRQTISELGPGIRGTTLIAAYGLVLMTCVWPTIAMTRGMGISNRVFITSMESIGVGCVGIAVFRPESWPWNSMTWQGHLHLISACAFVFAAMPVAYFAASRALPNDWRRLRFYSLTMGMGSLALVVSTIDALAGSPPNPFAASHLGLIERTYVFAFLVWQCIVSANVVRATPTAR